MTPTTIEAGYETDSTTDEFANTSSLSPESHAGSQEDEVSHEPEIYDSFVESARDLVGRLRRREEQFARLMRITAYSQCL